MGNQGCCGQDKIIRQAVTYLQNEIPKSNTYQQIQSKSIRFGQVSLRKSQKNNYIFTMEMKSSNDIILQIPVLTQLVQCLICQNYQLIFTHKMLIDIFNKQYSQTLIETKNQKSNTQFSMKVYPFRGYSSYLFKKGLHQIWLNRKIQKKFNDSRFNILRLVDFYIFAMNEDRQSLVLLFEKVSTSLANIAQYRLKAKWPWTKQEKLSIFAEVIEAYSLLNGCKILHRNIRPSNIFYNENVGRFVIGNLSKGRYFEIHENKQDLLTVYGVPFFTDEKVKNYIQLGQQIGKYNGLKTDYIGLKSILNILETCNIFDKSPHFIDDQLARLNQMLINEQPISQILMQVNNYLNISSVGHKSHQNDQEIAKSVSYLLAHTHKVLIQEFCFESYYNLGYNKEFSEIAHRQVQRNQEDEKQLNNAFLWKRLAQFNVGGGIKGTEYYNNALNLFLKRVEKMIKYGNIQKSQEQLQEAKSVFLKINQKIQTKTAKVELDRVRSLILLQKNQNQQALNLIQKTIVLAAKELITLQTQLNLILTYSKILKLNNKRLQAEQRIKYGLGICGNSSQFKSPSSCRIYKSNFYFQLGIFYADQIYTKHNPQKSKNEQIYRPQYRAMAQANFKAALQIRQRQNIDDIQIIDCLDQLGRIYYIQQQFYQAKRTLHRGLVRMNNLKSQISGVKLAQMTYAYGSCCYYLGQFEEAKRSFENAVIMLQSYPNQYILKYNIEGNMGLSMMQMGLKKEGKDVLFGALEKIKNIKKQNSYDYACLMKNYYKINTNQK